MTAESNAAETPLPSLRDAWLRSADRWLKLAALLEKGSGYTPRKIAPRPSRRPQSSAVEGIAAKKNYRVLASKHAGSV
jgi:hypothetical protein